jgi:LDH2 family malate/lactate/ureidoglycolate dehydrogenase
MEKDKTVPNKAYSDIFEATKTALMAHGAAQMQAEHVAHATAHSEMHGNVICGLQYVESYCIQLAISHAQRRQRFYQMRNVGSHSSPLPQVWTMQ